MFFHHLLTEEAHHQMNKLCKKYIKEVKLLFPIMGKNEKIYIKRLQASVEDCMEESHSTSLQELYETFGSPKDVLTSYLASVDTDDISKLIKKKVYVKRFFLFLAIIALITSSIHIYQREQTLEIMRREEIVIQETVIE